MTESKAVRNVVVAGLVAGPVAVALALAALVVAIVQGGGDQGDPAALQKSIGEIESRFEQLTSSVSGLEARLAQLEVPRAEAPRHEPLGEADVARIAAAQARELHVRTGGRAPVAVMDVPRAVLDACLRLAPGIALTKAEQRAKGGRIFYTLEGSFGGDEYELDFWDDATLREGELPAEFAPQEVKTAAAAEVAAIEITRVRVSTDESGTVYRLEGKAGGETCRLRMRADGAIVETEVPASLLPQAVREAAARAVDGFEAQSGGRETDDGATSYRVAGSVGRDRYELTLSADGTPSAVAMPISCVPQAVLDAVAKAVPGLRNGKRARKTIDAGAEIYEIEGQVGRRTYLFDVKPDGTIVRTEAPDDEPRDEQPGHTPALELDPAAPVEMF